MLKSRPALVDPFRTLARVADLKMLRVLFVCLFVCSSAVAQDFDSVESYKKNISDVEVLQGIEIGVCEDTEELQALTFNDGSVRWSQEELEARSFKFQKVEPCHYIVSLGDEWRDLIYTPTESVLKLQEEMRKHREQEKAWEAAE